MATIQEPTITAAAPVNCITLTGAKARQVGGDHYSRFRIQPVELVQRLGLSFEAGNVVKYLTRYRYKNGRQDLEKARHYIDLIFDERRDRTWLRRLELRTVRFLRSCFSGDERDVLISEFVEQDGIPGPASGALWELLIGMERDDVMRIDRAAFAIDHMIWEWDQRARAAGVSL